MKTNVMFDTLAYANKLKAAGADPKRAEVQAEANAEMITSLVEGTLATKQDIADLRADLRQEIAELETRLTVRLGGLMIGTMTAATAILPVLHFAH